MSNWLEFLVIWLGTLWFVLLLIEAYLANLDE